MAEKEQHKTLGLIGKNIAYSFSRGYFSKKFEKENLENYDYVNFDIDHIDQVQQVFNTPNLKGCNVTIPYKETIIPYLDKLNKKAQKIGAINTIRITKKGKKIGYNTDAYGFKKSLKPYLKKHHKKALILGTGGASKAVAFALNELDIPFLFVSRNSGDLRYENLSEAIVEQHQLIINCTPLGTSPNIEEHPNIPYQFLTKKHLLYDLIYNPEKTTFLKKGELKGATITNGLRMLELQAEKAWKIWNKD